MLLDATEIKELVNRPGYLTAKSTISPSMMFQFVWSTVAVLGLSVPFAKVVDTKPGVAPPIPVPVAVLLLLFAMIVCFMAPGRIMRAVNLGWLNALDLPLDKGGYIEALNTALGPSGVFVVEIRLKDGAVVPQDRLKLGGTLLIEPGLVKVTTPCTSDLEVGSSISVVSNKTFHAWFKKAAEEVLVPLSKAFPIESIEVKVTGPTMAEYRKERAQKKAG